MAAGRIRVCFVVGGRYHDFDFARLEILKLLSEHERIRVQVAETYRDLAAIRDADALVTYTCDLRPDDAQQRSLLDFVGSGGRWLALHGTNSILEWTREGKVDAPDSMPLLTRLLGSRFIAHPPLGEFDVCVSAPSHPLVRGIGTFKVTDELYLSELYGPNHVLLETRYNGRAAREFTRRDWFSDEPRPVLYLHDHGAGAVLYFTLGHCRGRYDMQPLMEEYPRVERCSWESPVYYELLRRGIRWAARLEDEVTELRGEPS
ncbi:MAG TPA: ThuA domain-containing protein [Steroidobacteraceae bacterium]|nr:ThuA domain-containing protein [Steroidobacteraceae bacterium]